MVHASFKFGVSANAVMKKLITFGPHENVTNPGMDGVALAYSFTVLPLDLVGSPEEKFSTVNHRLIVSISDSRLNSWHLSEDDLTKVCFEFGKRFVRDMAEGGSLPDEFTIKMPMITTSSHSGMCPFEISSLQMSNGAKIEIEGQRKIGFMR